eukprot:Gregarina_sp_Poly_1__6488@NODE_3473_length_1071_cov_319_919323_g2203_i0_p1_GENE_NODE_3473_length_1071_cov_319_919323_g2203_i0NODE_3473_length_1071_cov_319_919323_g2203_i0_p1_ORF_typecomplete_len185_score22_09PhyH/PF05721_13/0_04_NODE_3473_length_1071_cov_319_919323_g2203_i0108662
MDRFNSAHRRQGTGYIYHRPRDTMEPKLLRWVKGVIKTALLIIMVFLILDFRWLGFPIPTIDLAQYRIRVQQFWKPISAAVAVFLAGLIGAVWIYNLLLRQKIQWSKVDRWDTDGPTQYPDGFVFVSNRMSPEELERVKDETTRRELRALFRTPEWRAHLRERGPDEAAYNWQKRKSEMAYLKE